MPGRRRSNLGRRSRNANASAKFRAKLLAMASESEDNISSPKPMPDTEDKNKVVVENKKPNAVNFASKESIDFEEVIVIQGELKDIEDKNTALAHVRNLQEYAMLNDNYRAIGLLSQVEAALISPPKNEDFEC